jgi:predicted alternative tryptophan synthase beta-subunit
MSPNLQKTVFMMQTEFAQKTIAQVGEAITHELGAQMITDYQAANPTDTKNYQIGRNIIEQILSQPGCAGIKFYNAYNEAGRKTLVYVGINEAGKSLVKYTTVSKEGSLGTEKAIVADRTVDNDTDFNAWEWLSA